MPFTKRDTSRLRLKFPDNDYNEDGTVDVDSDFYVCIFEGPTWSGFTKTNRRISCAGEDANIDALGNLIEAYAAGSVIDYGTLSFTVDWDPNETTTGGNILSAFRNRRNVDYRIEVPAEGTETAGPVLVLTAHITNFTPQGTVFSENDEARLAAGLTLQISDLAVIAATTP